MDLISGLLTVLGLFTVFYLVTVYRGSQSKRGEGMPGPFDLGIGFVTNFFDTLGIGSYAPTTAIFRAWKLV